MGCESEVREGWESGVRERVNKWGERVGCKSQLREGMRNWGARVR